MYLCMNEVEWVAMKILLAPGNIQEVRVPSLELVWMLHDGWSACFIAVANR